ncbi:DUF4097 domain-containing protein [Alkalihalophilus marmarensis]|uniref:DUF4097 domain-containing protein n=1 Tax=Alkalihalophilus marmarensis TaxID=521377 RepID=UPI002E24DDE2|nr:DUF4097 domain-containing protein [Alkalihalophilus marmarensis]
MKKIAGVALIIIGAVLFLSNFGSLSVFNLSGLNNGGEKVENVDQPLEGNTELFIESTSVDIRVEPSSDENMSVDVIDKRRNQTLRVEERGNRLTIRMEERNSISIPFLSPRRSTEMIIYIPEINISSFEAKSVSGDITINTPLESEEVFLKTISGDVHSSLITADEVSIHPTSGDLKADSIESEKLVIKSTSGDIEVESFSGELDANTVSGDILVTYTHDHKDAHLKTVSGDITMWVRNLNAQVDLKTTSGGFTIDEQLTEQQFQSRSLKGTAGSGEYVVTAVTVSGDTKLLNK